MNSAQLEEHFEAVDISQFEEGGANHFTAADVKAEPAAVLGKVCNIYHVVRPFLSWGSNFLFVPKKVKAVIKSFMALMDTVCPES